MPHPPRGDAWGRSPRAAVHQPFLTPQELEIVLGIRPMEHYVFDEFFESSN